MQSTFQLRNSFTVFLKSSCEGKSALGLCCVKVQSSPFRVIVSSMYSSSEKYLRYDFP